MISGRLTSREQTQSLCLFVSVAKTECLTKENPSGWFNDRLCKGGRDQVEGGKRELERPRVPPYWGQRQEGLMNW